MRLKIAFPGFLLAFLTSVAPAQQPTPPGNAPTIKTNVDEVLVDLIVRDKKGKPIYDVKPGDVTVTDNGVKQQLTSFRLVQGAEAVSGEGAHTALDSFHQ